MDWDDLKYLLAVADAGALAPAAKAMAVDPSTVSRRITAIEKDLAAELVARTPEGMTLTPAGHAAVAVARRIAGELEALAAELAGSLDVPAGIVRVSTTEAFATNVMRAVAPLHAQYPRLQIDVVASAETVDLRRREADLAVRMYRDEHDGLALRKLGQLGWSLYATERYLASHPSSGGGLLDGHAVVGYTEVVMAGAQWLAQHAKPEQIRVRTTTPRAALDAALADLGVCVVPCYLAEREPGIVRLTDQVLAHRDVWAVFLPERRGDARLRVVIDALVAMFAADGVRLAGGASS
ncbi:MAG: LysR family transcriptional regulator [Deltaproteobacteria bacterium]|nr:LysR family transcriptional regulator [Deltaproteobacteria bacterium]